MPIIGPTLQPASALGKEGADGTKQKGPGRDSNSGHIASDVAIVTLFAPDADGNRIPAFAF
jgi:hypothetical protein